MGLLSAFLLAICPWHVMMSRWGLDANLAPGFLIFGLYFFLKGLEDNRYLLLSAFFYGLSLYCYAVIWTIVPVMLALSILYGMLSKKLRINRWSMLSSLLLFLLALPLLLFVLVNQSVLPEIRLPFMTIPAMVGYRGGEFTLSPAEMWKNFRRVGTLLVRQDLGSPYDILLPHGLFYDIGRIFIIVGFLCLVYRMCRKLMRRQFSYEVFLFIQLIGGGIVALLVTVNLHQINCLFIPLVLCEAYGVECLTEWIEGRRKNLAEPVLGGIILVYLICLVWFQKDYYTDYRQTVNAYFAKGVEKAVPYAMEQGNDIIAAKGTQWPRILLYSETTGSQYLENVVYAQYPAPASFQKGDITFHIGIDYSAINPDSIYIIYYTDAELFQKQFDLTKFEDWYVAVPKNP